MSGARARRRGARRAGAMLQASELRLGPRPAPPCAGPLQTRQAQAWAEAPPWGRSAGRKGAWQQRPPLTGRPSQAAWGPAGWGPRWATTVRAEPTVGLRSQRPLRRWQRRPARLRGWVRVRRVPGALPEPEAAPQPAEVRPRALAQGHDRPSVA